MVILGPFFAKYFVLNNYLTDVIFSNSAHKAVDERNAEIDKLISYIEQAKKDDVPKELIHSYSIRLDHLLSQGNSISRRSLKNKKV